MDELKNTALAIAAKLRAAGGDAPANTGGGSRQRNLPEELRLQFIEVRSQLFTRGIYDPVLVRFDTATGQQASNGEIAEALERVFGRSELTADS
jgi:hypothetical protein